MTAPTPTETRLHNALTAKARSLGMGATRARRMVDAAFDATAALDSYGDDTSDPLALLDDMLEDAANAHAVDRLDLLEAAEATMTRAREDAVRRAARARKVNA